MAATAACRLVSNQRLSSLTNDESYMVKLYVSVQRGFGNFKFRENGDRE